MKSDQVRRVGKWVYSSSPYLGALWMGFVTLRQEHLSDPNEPFSHILSSSLRFLLPCLLPLAIKICGVFFTRPRSRPSSRSRRVGHPLNAEFLLYLFMTSDNCDALVGDLEERCRLIRKKFGQRRANFWYWTQVLISLRPIIWAWVKKVSGVVALIEAYRRMRS